MEHTEKRLYIVILSMLLMMIVAGFATDGIIKTVVHIWVLQYTRARLIQDFTVTSIGAALVNAALVGLIGLIVVFFSEVHLAGPTVASILTITGFGLFGNTPFNSIPIILGVWIASRLARKSLGSYSLIALFGTALGPLVTLVAFELTGSVFWMLPLSIIVGLAVGFILPAVAGSLLVIHQGYNLYNVGFSCGFIGLFAAGFLKALHSLDDLIIVWNTQNHLTLMLLIPVFAIYLIICGVCIEGKHSWNSSCKDFIKIQKHSGRLPSDFTDMNSIGGTLINMGVLALICWTYAMIITAPLNGPVLGGIFTVIAFGGFGKHVRNCLPVMAGVIIATLVFGKSLVAPGPILALFFCTTLAPIAGHFGWIAGIIVGFIHLFMVETTATWHGGLDLYNNGFAGGLTATLFVAFMQWYRTNRPQEDFKS